jgi:DNA-binding SARP family transcriptional activator
MDFRLLGPLEVFEDERPLALGGVTQRSLLAILLLHANELVSGISFDREIRPPAELLARR